MSQEWLGFVSEPENATRPMPADIATSTANHATRHAGIQARPAAPDNPTEDTFAPEIASRDGFFEFCGRLLHADFVAKLH
jgi:hypothetical protein